MVKPSRNKRVQQESRARNHIEEQDDADQFEHAPELDLQSDEGTDEADGNEPDEAKVADVWEDPES
jgi:hypothetical protein